MGGARANTFPVDRGWLLAWRDLGVDARAVLRRARLPEGLLSHGATTLDADDYFRLWSATEAETGDAAFAIRLADVVSGNAFHPAVYAPLCSPNFAVGVARLATYKRLVAPVELVLEPTSDEFAVEFRWFDPELQPPPSLAGFELVFLVKLIRLATREHVVPLRVGSLAALHPHDVYARCLGVPVATTSRHQIVFRRQDAERPFLTANEAMWEGFEPALRRRLADLDASETLGQRVRAALLEALPGGHNSMDDVAEKLGLSKRTLQRRLRAESTTFKAILNETREHLARHYLSRTELPAAEIAFLLGFEDPNSFFRAFHNWTGLTTEQVRGAKASRRMRAASP